MRQVIVVIISVILTSFYYFPFEFVFLPGINTKMALAGVGLVLFFYNFSKRRDALLNTDFMWMSLLALMISFMSLVAMTYNNTPDTSFVSYFISMWVWMGGAYAVIQWLKISHKCLSIKLIADYLILVCVCQCIIAFAMTLNPVLKNFVDGFIGGKDAFMGIAEGRIYGIGCALDVAGLRFCAVLVIIAYLCFNHESKNGLWQIVMYIISFIVIAVVGNMIARTTTVGVILGVLYFIIASLRANSNNVKNVKLFWWVLTITLLIVIPVLVTLYAVNMTIRDNIRFGFEGFFSLAETGKWQTTSNNILLNNMIVFPDNMRTWIIGDGYAANPYMDPHYTGPLYHGFYKGTDIGYIRFVFYFGIIGLALFVILFAKFTSVCAKRFPAYKNMFYMLLLVNYVGWFKVTSDIFPAFAMFLVISTKDILSDNSISDDGWAEDY